MPTYRDLRSQWLFLKNIEAMSDIDERMEALQERLGQLMQLDSGQNDVLGDAGVCLLYLGADYMRCREFKMAIQAIQSGLTSLFRLPELNDLQNERISRGLRDLATSHFQLQEFDACLGACETCLGFHQRFEEFSALHYEILESVGRLLLYSIRSEEQMEGLQAALEWAIFTAIRGHDVKVVHQATELGAEYVERLYEFGFEDRAEELAKYFLGMFTQIDKLPPTLQAALAIFHHTMVQIFLQAENRPAAEYHSNVAITCALAGISYHQGRMIMLVQEAFSTQVTLIGASHRFYELEKSGYDIAKKIRAVEDLEPSVYYPVGLLFMNLVTVLDQSRKNDHGSVDEILELLTEAETYLHQGATEMKKQMPPDQFRAGEEKQRRSIALLRSNLLLKKGDVVGGQKILSEFGASNVSSQDRENLVQVTCESSKAMRLKGDGKAALELSLRAMDLAVQGGISNSSFSRCLREHFESLLMVKRFREAAPVLQQILDELDKQIENASSMAELRLLLWRADDILDTAQELYLGMEDVRSALLCHEKAQMLFDLVLRQLTTEKQEIVKLHLERDRLEQAKNFWSTVVNIAALKDLANSPFDLKIQSLNEAHNEVLQKISAAGGKFKIQGIKSLQVDLAQLLQSASGPDDYYVAVQSLKNCVIFYIVDLRAKKVYARQLTSLNENSVKQIFLYKKYNSGRDVDEAYRSACQPSGSMFASREGKSFHLIDTSGIDFDSAEWKGLGEKELQRKLEELQRNDHERKLSQGADDQKLWHATLHEHMNVIGSNIARHLDRVLQEVGAVKDSKVLLNTNGWLSRTPLACGGWEENGRTTCLLEKYDVALTSSFVEYATLSAASRRVSGQASCFEFSEGANKLPFANADVASVRKSYPTVTVYSKDQATYRQLLEAIRNSSLLVFTGHGGQEFGVSWNSSIFLKDHQLFLDDVITEIEVKPGAHVMLLACQTARSENGNQVEEYLGLHRGFLWKGASSAWGSFWPVSDMATAFLTHRAFECLKKGISYRSALREAQLWLRAASQEELIGICEGWYKADLIPQSLYLFHRSQLRKLGFTPLSHPYYWAGFAHFGV